MSQYDDVFPTRNTPNQGSGIEREMLDSVGGAHGIRTKVFINDLDGSTTLLRTRAGSPEFYTTPGETADTTSTGAARGLVAYPTNNYNGTWARPQLIVWDGKAGSWTSILNNPSPLKVGVAAPPAWSSLQANYTLDLLGNASIALGANLFFGMDAVGSAYAKWKQVSYSGASPAILAFRCADVDAGSDDKYVVEAPQDALEVRLASGALVRDFRPTRRVNGEEKPFVMLPPAATADGAAVCLNGCNATNWGVPVEGFYEAQPEKQYKWLVVYPTSATTQAGEANLHCYSHFDGTWAVTGDAGDPDPNLGKPDSLAIGWVRGTNANGGNLGTLGCPAFYVPPHYRSYSVQAPWTQSSKLRQTAQRLYTLPLNTSTTIGKVAVGKTVSDVVVKVSGNLNQKVSAEGQGARGDIYPPDAGSEIYGWVHNGDTYCAEKRTKMDTSNTDSLKVRVEVGQVALDIFQHDSTSSAGGRYGYRDRAYIPTVAPWSAALFTEMTAGYPNSQRDSGGPDEGKSWGVWYNPDGSHANTLGCDGVWYWGVDHLMHNGTEYIDHDIYNIRSEIPSWETYVDKFGLNKPTNTITRVDETDTPYAGVVDFSATSRNILAFDPNLQFVAYVEIHVESRCNFSSDAHTWVIAPNAKRLESSHTVTAKFAVQYLGQTYYQDLFSETFNKPGPWYRQQIIDYRSWPWPPQIVPDTVYTVQGPRIWPDVNKYTSVDKFFMHQGVCPDLAGVSAFEIANNVAANKTPVSTSPEVIFAKRFKFSEVDCNWIFADYAISEGKRTPSIEDPDAGVAYFYCPALRKRVLEDYYQVQFEANASGARFRVWTNDLPAKDAGAPKTTVDLQVANCFRI